MSTENKTPQKFYGHRFQMYKTLEDAKYWVPSAEHEDIRIYQEVLPETDGVWVSREDWEKIKSLAEYAGFGKLLNLMEKIERGGGK